MPVYEYVCTACRNRFERLSAMDKSQESSPCPDCGSLSARALSVFASFAKSPGGEMVPVGGGGCGSGDMGSCACSAGVEF